MHTLLTDFRIEDVWQVPVVLKEEHSLEMFLDYFAETNERLVTRGLAGALFRFRLFIGKIFKWDDKPITNRLVQGSLRDRYAQDENLSFEDLPDPGSRDFIPVYQLENEFLSEIENKTVHAALHLGRFQMENDSYGIQMAVYVKPKGMIGKIYMWFIKPFRHWIVYPALMTGAKNGWEGYLKKRGE